MNQESTLKTAIVCQDKKQSGDLKEDLSKMGVNEVTLLKPKDIGTIENGNFDLILAILSGPDEKPDWIFKIRQADYETNLVVISEETEENKTRTLFEAGITDVIAYSQRYLLRFRMNHYRTRVAEHQLNDSIAEKIALDRVTNALIEGKDTASISNLVLEGIYDTLGIERSRIYLYNEEENYLTLHAEKINRGLTRKLEERLGISLKSAVPVLTEDSVFLEVIRSQKTFITEDPETILKIVKEHTTNTLLKKLASWATGLVGIKTFAIFPLLSGSRLIGLQVFSSPEKLSDTQLDAASRFAQHASVVLGKHLDQQALVINEERFRAISNYTANWELLLDTTGKPVWTNPGVEAIIGYSDSELLAMPDYFERLVYKDDYPRVMSVLEDALKNKTHGEGLEFRIHHRNGKTKWFSISWKAIYDSSGNWIGIRSSAADISLRKQHEQSLIHRQAELRDAQDIARIGAWKWNPATESIYLSESLCKLLGIKYRNAWMPRENFLESIIHPDSRALVEKAILNVRDKVQARDLEISVTDAWKQKMILLIRASEQQEDHDGIHFTRGTALDITILKKSHDQIRESEARFRKIFESIHDVYYQADSNGILTSISPSVQDLLGYKPEELIGSPMTSFYSRQNLSEVKTTLLYPSNQLEQFEVTLFHKNQSPVVVSINQSRIAGSQPGEQLVVGLMRDITEKKKYETSLENQRKRLLDIVKLNTQIIETSDQFFYVIQTANDTEETDQLRYISPQVNKMLGISELDLLKMNNLWRKFIHPDDLENYDESRKQMERTKKPVHFSYRVKKSNTENYIWTDEYSCPLLDESNKIIEIYGSVRNVTDHVNTIFHLEQEKKQSMAYQYQLLSSQLNPHFIYNTLNSFQYYILQGNIEESLNHISDFSQLMRRVLENSMSKYITLDEEILFLEQYIRISQKRMKDKLSFKIETDPEIDTSEILIPPMLLQPYVENAIIHAFSKSPRTPELYVAIYQDNDIIRCLIEDNGIGRENAMLNQNRESMDKKRSIAMNINQTRLSLLNQITDRDFRLKIEDRVDSYGNPCGTRVLITYQSTPQKVGSDVQPFNFRDQNKKTD